MMNIWVQRQISGKESPIQFTDCPLPTFQYFFFIQSFREFPNHQRGLKAIRTFCNPSFLKPNREILSSENKGEIKCRIWFCQQQTGTSYTRDNRELIQVPPCKCLTTFLKTLNVPYSPGQERSILKGVCYRDRTLSNCNLWNKRSVYILKILPLTLPYSVWTDSLRNET